jgi:serine/threonine-protein kinase HipA
MAESDGFSVWADWHDLSVPHRLGSVILSRRRGRRTAGFAFDDQWLARGDFRSLDPDVQPFRGQQYPKEGHPVFGFLTDSAPDRWGRRLMQRREAVQAASEDRQPRRLDEYDYLLGVHDRARLGGLRFRDHDEGPFLAPDDPWATPPWTRLRELQAAASEMDNPASSEDDSRWLEVILAPGSSLGGARPKATVQDATGGLWIAKFPAQNDIVDVGRWEYLVHRLAKEAGINVPTARIEKLSERGTTFLGRRGWQLSPAYDINPDPSGSGLSLEIDTADNRMDFGLVLSVARYFGLSRNTADRRLNDILRVISQWRVYAHQLNIPRSEIEMMAPTFRVSP